MRVLILADGSFARREHSLLARLEIGLADEGVRVAHAVPSDCRMETGSGIYSTSLRYESQGTAFSRAGRARRLIESLGESESGESGKPDIVHAFGEGAWRLAHEIAFQTGACVAIEVWSGALVHSAARTVQQWNRAQGGRPPALMTPGRILLDLLRNAAPDRAVFLTPWGVTTGDPMHDLLDPARAPAVTVVSTGRDPEIVAAALEGLATASTGAPELLIFLDSRAGDRAAIWKRARRLGLLDRLTVVADLEERREPILRTDLLIQPEALGEHRSITLSAMAAGTVVVARADPLVECVSDPSRAALVGGPSPAAWGAAVAALLADREGALALASRARDYVHTDHSLSGHVRGVCGAYESMLRGKGAHDS